MIPFEKAFEIVMSSARRLEAEQVDIGSVLNRILAEDVVSDADMPPFDKSAMDGYACRREDLANELSVVETIPAGYVPKESIGPDQCAKIMTGAIVPEGADCVIMVEFTRNTTQTTVRFVGKDTRDNICLRGEDAGVGDVLLQKGRRVLPQHIALLASVGCVRPSAACQPRVGIIATGSELVPAAEMPGQGQIRDSNSSQLTAQVSRAGGIPKYYGIAGDTEEAIDEMLKKAASENDVVIFSGGVSMGDFDLVPGILKQNGVELLFEKVAIKPGKPTVFGRSAGTSWFGLPGNPVSTFVIFELLVKPFLHKMMGSEWRPATVLMPLGKSVSRKRVERESWVPVVLTGEGRVLPVEYHGSAHSRALCSADGLISIPAGVSEISEGTLINVRQI